MTDQKRDLRSMKNKQPVHPKKTPAGQIPSKENLTPQQQQQFEQLRTMAKPYENRSRSQLLQDAMQLVRNERQQGRMDNAQLDGYLRALSPMLDAAQRQEMMQVIEQLKKA